MTDAVGVTLHTSSLGTFNHVCPIVCSVIDSQSWGLMHDGAWELLTRTHVQWHHRYCHWNWNNRYQIPTSSTTQQFPVPQCAPPGNQYQIRLTAFPNFIMSSPVFQIQVRQGTPCIAGTFDAADGTEPGCIPCPIGTYTGSTSARGCIACPTNQSTYGRGSTSVSACNRTALDPSLGYVKFNKTFFCTS